MENPVLLLAGLLFGILFTFLLIVAVVFIMSLFKGERKASGFEPKITIVVPAYNEEKFIGECLKSIASSSYPKEKMEVIVVDDGSTDRTAEIAKSNGVKIMMSRHNGKSEALNSGIKAASNGIIVTVDADMVLDKDCISELVRPFSDKRIGATTANCKVKNKSSILGWFQNIEYHNNNLVSNSFSKVFGNSMWFFGAVAAYRKEALEKAGRFNKVLAEDMDIALQISNAGFRTMNVRTATGYTYVPESVKELFLQRYRWSIGGLQAVRKKGAVRLSSPTSMFLGFTQYFGIIYSLLCLPVIAFLVFYWLPYNSGSIAAVAFYIVRWFSLIGIVYMLTKIGVWTISYYTALGIASGIISTALILASLNMFKERLNLKNMLAILFYFPYTMLLNGIICLSIAKRLLRVAR